jgi:hypothetical protein
VADPALNVTILDLGWVGSAMASLLLHHEGRPPRIHILPAALDGGYALVDPFELTEPEWTALRRSAQVVAEATRRTHSS